MVEFNSSSTQATTLEVNDSCRPDTLLNSTTSPHFLTYVNQTVYLATCIAGSIGNILVIVTIWRINKLHTVMYFVLASLAQADLLLCLFYLPFIIAELFNDEVWIWGRFLCKFVFYIYNMSCVVSILNLTALSVER